MKLKKDNFENLTRIVKEKGELIQEVGMLETHKMGLIHSIMQLDSEYAVYKADFSKKYGDEAKINMQTGEITEYKLTPVK